MTPQRILGVVVLVVGIILLVMGLNASGSVADQVSETFTGRYTDHTTWYIIGGIALSIIGLAVTLMGMRHHHHHGHLT